MEEAASNHVGEKGPNLIGWKSKKIVNLEFYRCPSCRHCQESIFYGADEMVRCFHCDRQFLKDNFGLAKVRRTAVECRKCGTFVSLTGSNANMLGIGYLCSDCQSYVGVSYRTGVVDPTEALKLSWNPTIQKRSERIDSDLLFTRCRTKKDCLIIQLLQIMAKAEDSRFMFVREKEHFAGMYFDSVKQKYLGFLVWTVDEKHAVLHQVFIMPDERRMGLAARLITFWVERFASKVSDKFGIEAPNDKALKLHAKLGHLKLEGDTATGIKCFFAPTF